MAALSVAELMAIYQVALESVSHCADAVERGFFDEYPRVIIRALNCHPFRQE